MKIKFNKFERVAGLFVVGAILGSLASAIGVAVQRGWFESQMPIETIIKNADGIHSGTTVQMAGLRAGSVDHVELQQDNSVKVRLLISERFFDRLRTDSKVQTIRPFIIGEKLLDLTVGSESGQKIKPGAMLQASETLDVMDLLSGKKMGPLIETLVGLADTIRTLMEAFADTERTQNIIKTFDEMRPLMVNANKLTIEAYGMIKDLRKAKVQEVVRGANLTLSDMRKAKTFENMQILVNNLVVMTEAFQKLVPTLNVIAPELPRTSLRAIEGLNELVVTLKAMQKSFLFRGSVSDVREEEAKKREPASAPGSK